MRWWAFEAVTQTTSTKRLAAQKLLNSSAYETRAWFEQLCFGSGVYPIDPSWKHLDYQLEGASLATPELIDACRCC